MGERACVIVPARKRPADGSLDAACSRLRAEGHAIDLVLTESWEDTEAALADAGAGASTRIVIGGGDGTLSGVATRLPEGATLGILPLGTANDFAHACDLPVGDVEAALRIAVTADPIAVDLGAVDGKIFINMATGGAGAAVTVETPSDLKQRLGGFAYILSGIQRLSDFEPIAARVTGDGLSWEGRFYVVAVGNGRRAGGGMPLCPDAVIDDGLLDLTLIPEFDFARLFGAIDEGDDESGFVIRRKLSEVTIETETPLQVNFDGEPFEATRFAFTCRPGAVRVALPPATPLLQANQERGGFFFS
ncbi:YegS/Rv2252/BmrU family lipid kinase [Marinivivus vitaminiproducens]|uniref:YegS/Rv2252/BmrU family lipid kinase n=1 Tax=Marinivivus vitaminiproducens TaxID=3035935 RepID=UPI00279FD5A6|nr:YegS/Rv2252/BmrU family lipid kinase [Geminicoccaceae bacterium SCSIO 64248]